MDTGQLNWIAGFIWGIADDVLRDVYVCGKYRDVILPMTVIRRLDAILEPTKADVLKLNKQLDEAGVAAPKCIGSLNLLPHVDCCCRKNQQNRGGLANILDITTKLLSKASSVHNAIPYRPVRLIRYS